MEKYFIVFGYLAAGAVVIVGVVALVYALCPSMRQAIRDDFRR